MPFPVIVSGLLVTSYSKKDLTLLVKLIYKNDDCVPAALNKFQSLKEIINKGCDFCTESKEYDSEI